MLRVPLPDFILAIKPFRARYFQFTEVILAFEGEFLSVESGNVKAVMRAEGNWEGRAYFSPTVLRALVMVPPSQNPIVISYADDHLLFGGMTIACEWIKNSKVVIQEVANPTIVDFLAMERTAPRSTLGSTGLGRKIRSAHEKAERRIKKAAKELGDLNIHESEIRALLESKIRARIESEEAVTCNLGNLPGGQNG